MPIKAMAAVRCDLMLRGLYELGQLMGKSSFGMLHGGENDRLVDRGRGEGSDLDIGQHTITPLILRCTLTRRVAYLVS